jgi:hypothetical protein
MKSSEAGQHSCNIFRNEASIHCSKCPCIQGSGQIVNPRAERHRLALSTPQREHDCNLAILLGGMYVDSSEDCAVSATMLASTHECCAAEQSEL